MTTSVEAQSSGKVPSKELEKVPESQLLGLVYVSSVVHQFGPGEFDVALAVWRERNSLSGITGLLLRKSGDVLQYLEGPEAALTLLYAGICVDRRHRGIIEIMRELIACRQFPFWPMGYIVVPPFPDSHKQQANQVLEVLLDPAHETHSSARILIDSFWNGAHPRRTR